MINYQTNSSPFFESNKKYCEAIETQLKSFNYEYSGFCSSFGYEIDTAFYRKGFAYKLKFIKHQTTRRGIVPIDARDFAGLELEITGLDPDLNLAFGKSSLKRLFILKEYKALVPSPYYFTINRKSNESAYTNLVNLLLENKVDTFKLKKGNAFIEIYSAKENVFEMIEELEKGIVNCY